MRAPPREQCPPPAGRRPAGYRATRRPLPRALRDPWAAPSRPTAPAIAPFARRPASSRPGTPRPAHRPCGPPGPFPLFPVCRGRRTPIRRTGRRAQAAESPVVGRPLRATGSAVHATGTRGSRTPVAPRISASSMHRPKAGTEAPAPATGRVGPARAGPPTGVGPPPWSALRGGPPGGGGGADRPPVNGTATRPLRPASATSPHPRAGPPPGPAPSAPRGSRPTIASRIGRDGRRTTADTGHPHRP